MRKPHPLACILAMILLLVACKPEPTPLTLGATENPPSAAATALPTAAPIPTDTLAPTPTEMLPQGTLLEVTNLVDAHPLPEEDWIQALVAMEIFTGGEVWAKESSTALVGMLESGRIRVAPNTIFTLQQPDPSTFQIDLDEGQIWVNIEGLQPGETFEVETPAAVASVRGTRFSVRVDQDGTTVVSVQTYTVTVTSPAGAVDVGHYKQTTVVPGAAPTPPEHISPVEQVRWGWAGGTDLSVISPVYDVISSITLPGISSGGKWSGDATTFALDYGIPQGDNGYRMSTRYLDINAGAIFTPTAIPQDTYRYDYNPAGDGIAWMDGDGICTSPTDGSSAACTNLEDLYTSGASFDNPLWSPDGQWILLTVKDFSLGVENTPVNLYRIRPDGTEFTALTAFESGVVDAVAWSPDGASIAYCHYAQEYSDTPGEAYVYNTTIMTQTQVMDNVSPMYTPIAWRPDSQQIALPTQDGLFLISPDGSTVEQVPGTEPGNYSDIGWSPNPTGFPLTYFYYNTDDKSTMADFYYTGGGTPPRSYNAFGLWGPVWSPDGSLAAYGFNSAMYGDDGGASAQTQVYFFSVVQNVWP